MKKLIELLKLDAKATEDQVVAAVQALQDKLAALDAEKKQLAGDEAVIAEKMGRGLSRAQAIAVIHRQREFDKAQAESKKKAEAEAAKKK